MSAANRARRTKGTAKIKREIRRARLTRYLEVPASKRWRRASGRPFDDDVRAQADADAKRERRRVRNAVQRERSKLAAHPFAARRADVRVKPGTYARPGFRYRTPWKGAR